jgi:hypothetical protein
VAVERERRKDHRVLVNWPVVVVTPQRYIGGEVKNISAGGAAVACTRDPGRLEPLRLAIKIPTSEELVQARGIVVWSKLEAQPNHLYGCQTGIRFISFMGKSRQYLDEALPECLRSK